MGHCAIGQFKPTPLPEGQIDKNALLTKYCASSTSPHDKSRGDFLGTLDGPKLLRQTSYDASNTTSDKEMIQHQLGAPNGGIPPEFSAPGSDLGGLTPTPNTVQLK